MNESSSSSSKSVFKLEPLPLGKVEITSGAVPSTSSAIPISSPFSSSSEYSSSLLGFSSSDSCDDEDEGDEDQDQKDSELTPISDLELTKFLEKPAQALDSPEDILSLLNSSEDCKSSKFKKKIKRRKHKLLKKTLMPPSSQSQSDFPSLAASTSRPRKQSLKTVRHEDSSVPVTSSETTLTSPQPEFDHKDVLETVLKIKEEPESLLGESERDFKDILRPPPPPVAAEQTNLSLTVGMGIGLDDEDEDDSDNDEDSLSEYMNITANSAISLDPYFKFDTDEMTSGPPSAASSVNAPSSSAHSTSNLPGGEEKDCSKEKDGGSSSESLVARMKKVSPQKQAKMIEAMNLRRKRVYIHMCKKEIGKVSYNLFIIIVFIV
jgi:hypothetical protein